MQIRTAALLIATLAAGSGCRTAAPPAPAADPTPAAVPEPQSSAHEAGRDPRLLALLWFQTSAEYRVLATAVYDQARQAIDRALGDPAWTAAVEQNGDFAALPPAVIVDVDETVLDNSAYEAELVVTGALHNPSAWKPWVARAEAAAVPGAVEFARYAASRGVTVFYVTNRGKDEEEATRRNLAALGFPLAETADAVLSSDEKPGYSSDKTSRRAEIARTHRILVLVGDDLNDFVAGARALPEERVAVAERHAERWGRQWFLLPNSEYGSWERALVGNERGLSEAEVAKRRLARLRLPAPAPQ
jgi:5'-nucleotidase (lipoprotein e(P4) family)